MSGRKKLSLSYRRQSFTPVRGCFVLLKENINSKYVQPDIMRLNFYLNLTKNKNYPTECKQFNRRHDCEPHSRMLHHNLW
jgi:hypothetical protein